MAPASALLWRSLRTHQIYGANTEVGKTIFTTTLSKTAQILWPRENVAYLKPVSTGPLDEADERYRHVHTFAPKTRFHTLYQYDLAESPHSAAPASGRHIPSDSQLIQGIHSHAANAAAAGPGWLFVETAGGVHSPSPSGTTQAELFKPLRLPAVLIGDSNLGGISQTIASFEALKIRGYDVEAVLLFRERQYRNYIYLAEYFEKHHGVKLGTIDAPPRRLPNVDEDIEVMKEFYNSQSTSGSPEEILSHLDSRHKIRIERLEEMAEKAHKTIWYPFTQQKLLSPANIASIDSAHGNFFQTHNKTGSTPSADQSSQNLLNPSFDGSASWWTQGLGHSNTQLTLAAAYAAGRYGHVMFAQAIHEPALKLAESILEGAHAASPASRFSRVFYTDNGSSGCEVAVKMALRAARNRYGWSPRDNIEIIGLKGSYHGDTIGVMDCADPNVYNEKVEWYRGRGFWFDYPTVIFKDGFWKVEIPEEWSDSSCKNKDFSALGDIFDFSSREGRGDERAYEKIIIQTLEKLKSAGRKFGALVMEPVVLGAGGMRLVDPLFQRTLVKVVRQNPHLFGSSLPESQTTSSDWSGLPVFFDEVFTGLYRLGNFSSGSMLQVDADIVVNAKLLTGGALPMCTTMTSESIFESFLSGDKSDALLHGHSYTAHPMGCQVGVESIKALRELSEGSSWDTFKDNWEQEGSRYKDRNVWSVWPIEFVKSLPGDYVEGAWALGSVLAVYVRDSAGIGYKSTASIALHENLLRSLDGWNIHNRILGNVLYLMVGQNTTMQEIKELCERIKTAVPGPK
ncbi:hypothetical protein Cpir12675_000958 [Ceratocystis pirilliformis]|uniref:Adenosylmethionine-8-amino-7-oxononanoate aminotransferase n=1 Tax=Ceratocystis pirilliformis TaxID=259994 RepID=A0ABR3ZI85_9PEZI